MSKLTFDPELRHLLDLIAYDFEFITTPDGRWAEARGRATIKEVSTHTLLQASAYGLVVKTEENAKFGTVTYKGTPLAKAAYNALYTVDLDALRRS